MDEYIAAGTQYFRVHLVLRRRFLCESDLAATLVPIEYSCKFPTRIDKTTDALEWTLVLLRSGFSPELFAAATCNSPILLIIWNGHQFLSMKNNDECCASNINIPDIANIIKKYNLQKCTDFMDKNGVAAAVYDIESSAKSSGTQISFEQTHEDAKPLHNKITRIPNTTKIFPHVSDH